MNLPSVEVRSNKLSPKGVSVRIEKPTTMGNLWSRFSNNFRDLTRPAQMETNSASFLNLLTVNDAMAEKYSRNRMQFYANLWEALNSPDPTVVDRVLGLEMKSRGQYETVRENLAAIEQSTSRLTRPMGGGGGDGDGEKTTGDVAADAPVAPEAQGTQGGKPETWYKKKDPNDPADYQEWKDHPFYSPVVEGITITDRIVFIAITYAFRGISLYLIEWSLHNRMITTFERAFWYYFFIYVSFIILLAFAVNVDTTNPMMRMMFYYLNVDVAGGYMRIYAHLLAQLLLIIIPFILRESSSETSQATTFLSFDERQRVMNTLSRFTLFMWILTSAIALRI